VTSLARDAGNASEESRPGAGFGAQTTPRRSRRARDGNDGGGRSEPGAACGWALATVSARCDRWSAAARWRAPLWGWRPSPPCSS